MSAHEAGHATLGITLGAKIEAVYARINHRLPDGNFRPLYMTRFGALGRAGLGLKDRVLLIAGGAAGEVLLMGEWDREEVRIDRSDLEKLGFMNFEYCVEQAIGLLRQNNPLLVAVREKIRESMLNLRQCKLAKNKTHIVLARGHEIDKLFWKLGHRADSSDLDLDVAKLQAGTGNHAS